MEKNKNTSTSTPTSINLFEEEIDEIDEIDDIDYKGVGINKIVKKFPLKLNRNWKMFLVCVFLKKR
jgi:hypothetical protein